MLSLLLLYFTAFANCQENFTMEDSALFFKMEPGDMDSDTDKSVQNIISWLQMRYNFGQRKERNYNHTEDLLKPDFDSPTFEPRPFGYNQLDSISDAASSMIPLTTVGDSSESRREPTANNEVYPPQINSLQVECQKDKMTVDLEFTSQFNGIIYSKDHYTTPECRYVVTDSNSVRYRFTVQLNSCGTQFINEYDKGGKAYLENVLVIQNEPGFLEIWDSVRSVRCLWEGSIRQSVTSGLNVVTPSTQVITFSGDTATAKLEIQTGKGPFASAEPKPANIGDMMTLVVKVEGDPEHQIRIGRCMAFGGGQQLQLSDDAGCPLRPKLMSAFEYTRNPSTNDPLAFSYFRAFKFPDSNELNFDCNVELCKKPCIPCQETNNHVNTFQDLGNRKKRSSNYTSKDENHVLTIRNSIWMSIPQQNTMEEICLPRRNFYTGCFSFLILLSLALGLSFCFYRSALRRKQQF